MDLKQAILATHGIFSAYGKKHLDQIGRKAWANQLVKIEQNLSASELVDFVLSHFEHAPSPLQILNKIKGINSSEKDFAMEKITALKHAVKKFGRYNYKAAKDFLGDDYQLLKKTCGGSWENACSFNFEDSSSLAQLRDAIIAHKVHQDCNEDRAYLSTNKNEKNINKALNIAKSLT